MEKIIQFLTKTPADAYAVVETLRNLDEAGDISVDEIYVIEKNEQGKTSLKDSKGNPVDNSLFGAFAGGLLGLLGGPAGFLLGTSFGLLTGSLVDWSKADNVEAYLEEVANKIPKGKSVVVSHVYEEWETPIDSKLSEISEITRINVDDEIDKAAQAELDEFDKEIDETEAELQKAADDAKADLQQKLADIKAKKAAKEKELRSKLTTQKKAYKNWFEKLKSKLKSK